MSTARACPRQSPCTAPHGLLVPAADFPQKSQGRPGAEVEERLSAASDQYLHRVGRAGRFGTKGLAISFIADQDDADQLAAVQSRFEVDIPVLPDQIDINTYMS